MENKAVFFRGPMRAWRVGIDMEIKQRDRTAGLGTEKLGKLLLSLAVPSIIAQVVNILYNMVDRIYIGRMEDGAVAMSALAVSMPVVTLILAFTQLVGVGGAPLAAIRLGEKDQDGAEKILTNSFVTLIATAVLLTLGILLFQKPLLYAFGADDQNIGLAMDYVGIYCLGTIFVQISFGLNAYINTQGQAKFGMATVVIGAALNIALDPLFIFVFGMGVKGAALATILSQAVSALWVLKFFFGGRSTIKIRKEYKKPELKILLTIMALGVSPFIMSATESLLQIAFNNQMSKFGGTMAVGTMAILLSLYQMINMPLQGLCQGAQPILSYNYGAKNMERVRKTFRLLLGGSLGVSLLGCGSIILFSTFFSSLFTKDPAAIRFSSWAIPVYLMGGMVFGMQIACQQSFLALGQAKRSLIMALFRKVILLIPLIYILPVLIGNTDFAAQMAAPVAEMAKMPGSAFAVLLAESVADIAATITTVTLFILFYRKHLKDPN